MAIMRPLLIDPYRRLVGLMQTNSKYNSCQPRSSVDNLQAFCDGPTKCWMLLIVLVKVREKTEITIGSPSLRHLSVAVSKKPLANLHLSVRAINALEKAGVTTIGELVDRVHIGSTPFRGTGGLTGREVQNALDALSEATNSQREGGLDFLCAHERICNPPWCRRAGVGPHVNF